MLGNARDIIGTLVLPFVRGSSSVVVRDGWITKFNHPTTFVRFLHLLAYGRFWHPYEDQDHIQLAKERRDIAALILEFEMGEAGLVAPIIKISRNGRGLGLTAPFIAGEVPKPSAETRAFFDRVVEIFLRTGLPTWQINPRFNPRALTNAICCGDHDYPVIIDLESQILNLFVSRTEWQTAWRNGHLVPFDEMDFEKLWAFVHKAEGKAWSKAPALRRCVGQAHATFLHLRRLGKW